MNPKLSTIFCEFLSEFGPIIIWVIVFVLWVVKGDKLVNWIGKKLNLN